MGVGAPASMRTGVCLANVQIVTHSLGALGAGVVGIPRHLTAWLIWATAARIALGCLGQSNLGINQGFLASERAISPALGMVWAGGCELAPGIIMRFIVNKQRDRLQ